MSLSTFSSAPYTSAPAMLVRRRIATYFVGGIDQIPALVATLTQHGKLIHELSVDVREGVRESSMVSTVLVSPDALDALLDALRALSSVVSAELA
ncbi:MULTISPECIES: hypothetical protein [Amycolatopsis]|uniref:hypothetical protein n=1 Tax=Amycolatopsis TaxID=1813 RepID=UPI00039D7204|nr:MULTISPECIES: hypothetical protein [Amycolatopsis]MCG3751035.1 hypothetical protein [Amycolatopsis sp. Poz14]